MFSFLTIWLFIQKKKRKKKTEEVYFKSQILERPSIGEY